MSDKNFKVKNGIDAVGPITISPSSNSIDGLIINTPIGGKSVRFIRNGTGEVGSIDEWGGLVTSGGIQVAQPWYTRSPGIEAQSFFWAGSTTRSAAGFGGTRTGTRPVIYISSHGAGTNDLTQWLKPDNTIVAKVDYLGNITANDLTLSGNLTVNGTTTNLNSTNLVIEDKNIIIADVATPTDTTADGAGITVKGATDKTFSWSNSTKSFISSEPLIINSTYSTTVGLIVQAATGQTSTNIFEVQRAGGGDPSFTVSHNYINLNRNTTAAASLVVYGANSGAVPLYVIGRSSQSVDLQQWQNSSGTVLCSISSNGNLVSNLSGTSTTFPIFVYTTSSATTPYGIAVARQNRSDQYIHIHESDGSKAVIEAVAPNAAKPFFIKNKSNEALYLGTNDTNRFSITSTGLIGVGIDTPSSAQMTLINSNSANTGLIIKGAASQAANLQEWQDSTGSLVGRIEFNGKFVTAANIVSLASIHSWNIITLGTNEASYSSATISASTRNAANPGLVIRGVASQTANLQEWQDSAGTVLVKVRSSGQLNVGGAVAATTLGVLNIDPAWTALKVIGAASQTGNLQEWQNSAGIVLGSIASDGTTTLGYQYLTSGTHKIYGVTQILNNSSGTSSFSVLNPAWSGNSSFTMGTTATDNVNNRNWQFVVGGGGYAGQSGNYIGEGGLILFENNPNDSSTTFRAGFRRGGQFALNSTYETYSANLSIKPISTSTIGIVIRANSSQTANLQEWQNSAGTTLAYVKDNGYSASIAQFAYIYTSAIQGWNGAGGSISFANALPIIITPQSASTVVLAIKGAASQTANLQEWQNNSGTVLAKIDKDGIITVPAINVVGQSISSNTTMIAGYRYFVDTSASRTLTLPSSATIGDEIQIFDSTNTAGTNNITINSNNGKIEGVVESYIIDVNGAAIVMTYTGSTYGWKVRM